MVAVAQKGAHSGVDEVTTIRHQGVGAVVVKVKSVGCAHPHVAVIGLGKRINHLPFTVACIGQRLKTEKQLMTRQIVNTSLRGKHPHRAVRVIHDLVNALVGKSLYASRAVDTHKRTCAGRKGKEAVARAERQGVGVAQSDRCDGTDVKGRLESRQLVGCEVYVVQSGIGAHPHVVAICQQRNLGFIILIIGYLIRTDKLAIGRKHVNCSVKSGQAHASIGCLTDAAHEPAMTRVLLKPVGLRVINEHALSERAYPHLSVTGLKDGLHRAAHNHAITGSLAERLKQAGSTVVQF